MKNPVIVQRVLRKPCCNILQRRFGIHCFIAMAITCPLIIYLINPYGLRHYMGRHTLFDLALLTVLFAGISAMCCLLINYYRKLHKLTDSWTVGNNVFLFFVTWAGGTSLTCLYLEYTGQLTQHWWPDLTDTALKSAFPVVISACLVYTLQQLISRFLPQKQLPGDVVVDTNRVLVCIQSRRNCKTLYYQTPEGQQTKSFYLSFNEIIERYCQGIPMQQCSKSCYINWDQVDIERSRRVKSTIYSKDGNHEIDVSQNFSPLINQRLRNSE